MNCVISVSIRSNRRNLITVVYKSEGPIIRVDLYRTVSYRICYCHVMTIQIQRHIGNGDNNTIGTRCNLIRLVQSEGIAVF